MNPLDQLRSESRARLRNVLERLTDESSWNDLGDLGAGNQFVAQGHRGRTLLELLQNARDAVLESSEDKGRVAVIVGPDSLLVANTGVPFDLHEDDIFDAVTRVRRSSKDDDLETIGEKGVGMKSILSAADAFSIRSCRGGEPIRALFRRSETAGWLLAALRTLCDGDLYADQLKEESPDMSPKACRECLQALESLDTSINWDDIGFEDGGNLGFDDRDFHDDGVPAPDEILRDLPRVPLFYVPHTQDHVTFQEEAVHHGRLGDALVDHQSNQDLDHEFGESLLEWLDDGRRGRFQTVVELDYVDEPWHALLDGLVNQLRGTDWGSLDGDALADDIEQNRNRSISSERADGNDWATSLWKECQALDIETLVLLETLEEIEFLKLSDDDPLDIEAYESISIEEDTRTSFSAVPESMSESVEQRSIQVETSNSLDASAPIRTQHYRKYTYPTEDIAETRGDGEPTPLTVLVEKPRPEDDDWAPSPQPLHLFYPIDEEPSPFSFVIHGPFEVGFNRTSLRPDSDQNEDVLDELPDLLQCVAQDLASSADYRPWCPWLFTPLETSGYQEQASEVFQDIVEGDDGQHEGSNILDTLAKTPCVPTSGYEELREPEQVLIDPSRLRAFEPFRTLASNNRLPEEDVIEAGDDWLDAYTKSVTEEERDGKRHYRRCAKRMGLTNVVDPEGEPDFVDVLCHIAGTESPESSDDWSLEVDSDAIGEAFFKVVETYFQSRDEDDEELKDKAEQLADHFVPLIPAAQQQQDSERDITHLVRAKNRRKSDGARERAERIVFRREGESEDDTSLPIPPDSVPVFITPYNESWEGVLDKRSYTWGTRKLEGKAQFYRRVGSEIGGLSTQDTHALENREAVPTTLGYLLELYRTVNDSGGGQTARWIKPIPYRQKSFRMVENMSTGAQVGNRSDTFDDYLEQRYLAAVPVPTQSGALEAAERTVFGRAWADHFRHIAQVIRESSDKDEGDSSLFPFGEPDTPSEAYQRWARAIEAIEDARAHDPESNVVRVAGPDDEVWNRITEEARLEASEGDVWLTHFLLHLGVQVGPDVEWGWLAPSNPERHRRTSALDEDEVGDMTVGEPRSLEGVRFAPDEREIESFVDVAWRSEHHPALTAGHSDSCRDNRLQLDGSDWCNLGSPSDVAIPAWYRLARIPSDVSRKAIEPFRRSICLLWEELHGSVLQTSWICSTNGHHVKSSTEPIPSLAMIQLREASIWPTDDEEVELRPAYQLTYQSKGQKPGRHLPDLHLETLSAGKEHHGTGGTVEFRDVARALGAKSVDERTPAESAKLLDSYLRRIDKDDLEFGPQSEQRALVYGLMSHLCAADHLEPDIYDGDLQREWLRRDVWHTGVRLPVNRGGDIEYLAFGLETESLERKPSIYSDRLPEYARAKLERTSDRFVELPSDKESALANLFRSRDENETIDFDLDKQTDLPALEVEKGTSDNRGYTEELDTIRHTLDARRDYLAAACFRVTAKDEDEISTVLDALVEREDSIGIVEGDGDGRHSAQWAPQESDDPEDPPSRIAIYRDAIERTLTEVNNDSDQQEQLALLAIDGLAQIMVDNPAELSDELERALLTPEWMLDREWSTALEAFDALDDQYFEEGLDRFNHVLNVLDVDERVEHILPDGIQPDDVLDEIEAAGERAESPSWYHEMHTILSETLDSDEQLDSLIRAAFSRRTQTRRKHIRQVAQADNPPLSDVVGAVADNNTHWSDVPGNLNPTLRKALEESVALVEFWEGIGPDETDIGDVVSRALHDSERIVQALDPLSTFEGDEHSELLHDDSALAIHPFVWRGNDERSSHTYVFELKAEEVSQRTAKWLNTKLSGNERQISDHVRERLEEASKALCDDRSALDAIRSENTESSHAKKRRKRRRVSRIWEDGELFEDISPQDIDVQENLESSATEIGEGRGGGSSSQSDAARTRKGELLVLERCWEEFRDLPADKRTKIVNTIRTWRNNHAPWRLASFESATSEFERVEERLTTENYKEKDGDRARFMALLDVAGERGPGFDMIDPFGSWESGKREKLDLHRVEVKTVPVDAPTLSARLTGNEYRMSLRPGPDRASETSAEYGQDGGERLREDDIDAGQTSEWDQRPDRYLLRLVGLPKEGDEGEPFVHDVDNFVEASDLTPATLPEKLRRGRFYIKFER